MEKFCKKNLFKDGYECPCCGNHVCAECAKNNSGVCPVCFGKLYRINN